jgi:hypothetical protein
MAQISAFTKSYLNMQGYVHLDDETKSRYALALRFSPVVCTTLIIIGVVLQSPIWLGVMTVVAIIAAILPRGHPIDLICNFGVRYLFGAPALPPNPKPRRFAGVVTTLLLIGSALSFQYGLPVLGFVLGGSLSAVLLVNTLTNWCLASWMYGLIFSRPKAV